MSLARSPSRKTPASLTMSGVMTQPIELPVGRWRKDAQVYAVEYRPNDSRDGNHAVLEGLAMQYTCV